MFFDLVFGDVRCGALKQPAGQPNPGRARAAPLDVIRGTTGSRDGSSRVA